MLYFREIECHGESIGMAGYFGFIHEKIEIKILILFILRRLSEPIKFEDLAELTMCDDGISYFDFSDCVAELVRTEHIKLEDGKYAVTEKGERNGWVTENSLPYSVRIKAEDSASIHRAAQNRNAMIRTSHADNHEGGCTVKLSLSDGVGDILSLELFSANERQARDLENGFRENAEGVYHAIIEMILG